MSLIPIERTIIWGYWLAFFMLVTIGIFTYSNSRELASSDYALAHTNQVLDELHNINAIALEMESAARGYAISPQPAFKTTVESGEAILLNYLMELNNLVATNIDQKNNVAELERKITRFALIQRTIVRLRDVQNYEAVADYMASSEALRVSGELKLHIRLIQKFENSLLEKRKSIRNELIESFNWLYISLLSSVFIAMIILYSNIITTLRRNKASS